MRRIVLPKTAADLLRPGMRQELDRAFSLLNALQNLKLVIKSGGRRSEETIQVSGGAAILTGTVVLTVAGGAPVFTLQPIGGTFAHPHSFPTSASGAAPITFQWQAFILGNWSDLGETPVFVGTQTSTLTITSPLLMPLAIRCVATNPFGSTISDEVTVTIT